MLRTPRHVSLRTQQVNKRYRGVTSLTCVILSRLTQRRLRHIKSVAVRNLAPLDRVSRDPHSVSIFFTIHDPAGSEKGNAHNPYQHACMTYHFDVIFCSSLQE